MIIKIPDWIKKSGGWVLSSIMAVGGAFLIAIQDPETHKALKEDMIYLYIGTDSTAIVKAKRNEKTKEILKDESNNVLWDTLKRETTDGDLHLKLQRWFNPDSALDTMLYCNGYTQFIIEITAVNQITGNARGQYCIMTTPEIGTNFVMKIWRGISEIAQEKIPEQLEKIPIEKAEELGWKTVIDTILKTNDKGKEVERETKKRWTQEEDVRPSVIVIPFNDKESIKEIENIDYRK